MYLKPTIQSYINWSLNTVTLILFLSTSTTAQVVLRDTTIAWRHHSFELNADYSMNNWSQVDDEIEEVTFSEAKVIENELIKIVLVPEYGGRVLSFVYKPTGNEYLYQSECGSPYGMNDGNFYYDWLMVWGGIFPTFPEPEHGKTWLLPWTYAVIKNTQDEVSVRMEYTDTTGYSGTPGGFNNGITNITCQIEISVYANSSVWDYEVNLLNNESSDVAYEYWTCTTLAPGSSVGNTGTPLNSEIILPVEEYFAAWSPGSWIGQYNQNYDMSDIAYLDDWSDMGIAYADNFKANYWGVINQDNKEGIMRVSANTETPGVKLWTWGRDNVDNNLFDFSNGGADNYIEIWAGVSESFFTDATLKTNEQKSWKESYCATVGMSGVDAIDGNAATHLTWDLENNLLDYEINTFKKEHDLTLHLYLDDKSEFEQTKSLSFSDLGLSESHDLSSVSAGYHVAYLELRDTENNMLLSTQKEIYVNGVLSNNATGLLDEWVVKRIGQLRFSLVSKNHESSQFELINIQGQRILSGFLNQSNLEVDVPKEGVYFLRISSRHETATKKLLIY